MSLKSRLTKIETIVNVSKLPTKEDLFKDYFTNLQSFFTGNGTEEAVMDSFSKVSKIRVRV
jgi:hypothetical protein